MADPREQAAPAAQQGAQQGAQRQSPPQQGAPQRQEAPATRKERTRRRLAETATRLFTERGFDLVTVAEIAEAAGVTEKTVFNHFKAKEDLVYGDDDAFETALLDCVRARPEGESALGAVRRFLLDRYGRMAFDADRRGRAQALAAIVTGSPTLQARERRIHARYADALCELITAEEHADPTDIRPRITAEALLTVHRGSIASVRAAILAGVPDDELPGRAITTLRTGLDLLAHGLDDYAVRTGG
ncbi:TetR/AcrR family transcriptional regulator [Spirillospora sp. NPDC047279]|uniref:TetR/AcrR family transcriptional regulator n=1 Tax=Spirillospora sp. NPDC047279 TaxID=3155478 RepID=UPI0033CFC123